MCEEKGFGCAVCREQDFCQAACEAVLRRVFRPRPGRRQRKGEGPPRALPPIETFRLLLTPREWQVLALVYARGLSQRRVAKELGLHRSTVQEFLRRAYRRIEMDVSHPREG